MEFSHYFTGELCFSPIVPFCWTAIHSTVKMLVLSGNGSSQIMAMDSGNSQRQI